MADWYNKSRVSQPGSVVLKTWNAERQAARELKAQRGVQKRSFSGAQQSRLTASWQTVPSNVNQLLSRDRRILVARSRELSINNEYAKQFMTLLKSNVVGASGISVSVQALRDNGELDEIDSAACEAAFKQFSKVGYFEVSHKLSRCDFERLYVETLARDGEVLWREHKRRGPHNYQVQFLDPLLIDDTYNLELPSGTKIRMGVEMDSFGKPLAYHLLPERVNDIQALGITYVSNDRVRVSADELHHDFIVEHPGQVRGIPWMAASALAMNMLGGYEESAVVAARVGASKMGFFKRSDEAPPGEAAVEALADAVDEAGTLLSDAEPGSFAVLPNGVDFTPFDPDYPHAMFSDFVKQCLRRVSAGLPGATYTSLSGDMESANYSSMRVDLIRERETWKAIQRFVCERFTERVYSAWLPLALVSRVVVTSYGAPLPFSKLKKFDAAVCQGTRWPWVDMEKEVRANAAAIEAGLTSRTRVIKEQGGDPEQIWKELDKERKRLKEHNAQYAKPNTTPASAGVAASTPGNDQGDPNA